MTRDSDASGPVRLQTVSATTEHARLHTAYLGQLLAALSIQQLLEPIELVRTLAYACVSCGSDELFPIG